MEITKFLRAFIETDVAIGGGESKKVLKKEEEVYVETSVKRSGNNIYGLTIIEVKVNGEISESIEKMKHELNGVKRLLRDLSTNKVRYELSYLISGLENEEINKKIKEASSVVDINIPGYETNMRQGWSTSYLSKDGREIITIATNGINNFRDPKKEEVIEEVQKKAVEKGNEEEIQKQITSLRNVPPSTIEAKLILREIESFEMLETLPVELKIRELTRIDKFIEN